MGETLIIEPIRSELEDSGSETTVYEIFSYPADFSLTVLFEKWQKEEIVVREFQRNFVWNITQASRLIESFLLGLPVPGVFLYRERATEKLIVIDGQQRLMSVFGFFLGKFPADVNFPGEGAKNFILEGVAEKWTGKGYEDLSKPDRIKLDDSILRATIIKQINPEDYSSIFEIFNRLNTGGTMLTAQEIRNSIFSGPFNNLLKELNLLDNWRKLVGRTNPDKRMRDVELILRFIALYYGHRNYFKPMKAFLSDFMSEKREMGDKERGKFVGLFESTVETVYRTLGPKPFHIKRGINAAVFDSVMIAFANNLSKIPDNIREKYNALIEDDGFLNYATSGTTDVEIVKQRIQTAEQSLFS